jgi:hypothetical protein
MGIMNFPNAPAVNDTVVVGNRTWYWTGTKWAIANTTSGLGVANTMSNTYFAIRSSSRANLNFIPGPSASILINVDDDSAGGRANITIDTASAIPTGVAPATMETATDNANFVTALQQPRHPGHPKAWGYMNIANGGALFASYGVSSIAYGGDGNVRVVLTTAFSSANYTVQAGASNNQVAGANGHMVNIILRNSARFNMATFRTGGATGGTTAANSGALDFACMGDQ